MRANKQVEPLIKPTAKELKLRLLQAQAKLGDGFRYVNVYEYFFGKLDDSGKDRLRNIWLTHITDETVTKQIEWIAENKNQAPTFNTEAA